MPALGSPVSTPAGMPAINQAHVGKLVGATMHFPTMAAFTAAITSGQTGYSADLWQVGQRMTISGEPAGCYRAWNGTHARTVYFGSAQFVLSADSNVVLATTGAPASGIGANGDIAIDQAALTIYRKTSGIWAVAVFSTPQMLTSAQIAAAPITPAFTTNSALAATANTAMLQQLAQAMQDPAMSRKTIVYPDGEVSFNDFISWKFPANQSASLTSITEAAAPLATSAGITTFKWTGGLFNGALWKYELLPGGGIGTGLRFENVRWAGPGTSVKGRAVAGTALSGGAGTVQLNSASGVIVGDAICIGQNPFSAVYHAPISRPWWGTVTAVSGNNVSFLPAPPGGFVANIGNVVQIWKQTRAVEIGGQTPDRQDVFWLSSFKRCGFIDLLSGVATQDCTTFEMADQCSGNRVRFIHEQGYNQDSNKYEQPMSICQHNARLGTTTSGSKVIASIPFTDDLKVGMSLGDITDPGVGQVFPWWAAIESIDSASQVTMTHAATASGARTLQPTYGSIVAQGSGSSPWYPREVAPYDGSRANCDTTYIVNPTINHIHELYATDGTSNGSIVVEHSYTELSQRLACIGITGAGAPGPYIFRCGVLSGSDAFLSPPIETIGGGINIEISGLTSSNPLKFPLFASQGWSNPARSIKLSQNNVSSLVQLIAPDIYYLGGITVGPNFVGTIDVNGSQPSGIVNTVASATGTVYSEPNGTDGVHMTLTGNVTVPNQVYGTPTKDRRYRVIADSTGAFTLTMSSNYLKQDGAAIGAIPVSASGKVCMMEFIGTGSRWVLVGGTLSAGAPVFVTLS